MGEELTWVWQLGLILSGFGLMALYLLYSDLKGQVATLEADRKGWVIARYRLIVLYRLLCERGAITETDLAQFLVDYPMVAIAEPSLFDLGDRVNIGTMGAEIAAIIDGQVYIAPRDDEVD